MINPDLGCVSTHQNSDGASRRILRILYLLCGASSGLAVGWIAHLVATRFAPLVVFPLAVGLVLGIVLIGLTSFFPALDGKTLIAAALASSLAAVCTQHYSSYLDARRKMEESKTINDAKLIFAELMQDRLPDGPLEYLLQEAAVGRPMPFGYVARGPMAWISWSLDALLLTAATLSIVFYVKIIKQKTTKKTKEELK